MLSPDAVLDFIRNHPGVTHRDLFREFGVAVSYHVAKLQRQRKIRFTRNERKRAIRHYFAKGERRRRTKV